MSINEFSIYNSEYNLSVIALLWGVAKKKLEITSKTFDAILLFDYICTPNYIK